MEHDQKPDTATERVWVRLTPEIKARLRRYCQRAGMTLAGFVGIAIKAELDKREAQDHE